MEAYDFPLLLKYILEHGVAWAGQQQIIYRDRMRYSYADMYRRVLKLASALQGLGVGPGSMVGVMEWDSHRYLEMYFGIPGTGAILHTINPRLALEDVAYTMEHAEDEILIFHEDFLPLVEQLRPRLTSIRKYILISDGDEAPAVPWVDAGYEERLGAACPVAALPDLDERTQATLTYTTGTTGRPKGVFFSHRQIVLQTLCGWTPAAVFGNYGGASKQEVYLPLTPMFHVHAWGLPYWATLLGLKQVYPGKFEPDMVLKLAGAEKVTFSHCVPTILQMVITAAKERNLNFDDWKMFIGGARLTQGLARAARERGIRVTGAYGLSETCPLLTLATLKPFMQDSWDDNRQLEQAIKTGTPMPLVKTRVVTATGQDVPRDGSTTGEIVVRAPWLTPGYFKDPEGSAALWDGGWMHTGDVAHVDQYGYLQIVDRMKNIIKSGGEWIVSLDIENLLSLHPDIVEAALIGVPDETWGERPLAVVVPRKGAAETITAQSVKEHLLKYVADGVIRKWAVPGHYVFVKELPKTSVGKIDKKALRCRYPVVEGQKGKSP